MGTFAVVQLNALANGTPGVVDRLVGSQINLFVLDAAPHPFDEHVVAPGPFAVHRQPHAPAQHGLGERARRELGGFNRSSQHLNRGGVYGATSGVDAEVDRARSDAIAGCAVASA